MADAHSASAAPDADVLSMPGCAPERSRNWERDGSLSTTSGIRRRQRARCAWGTRARLAMVRLPGRLDGQIGPSGIFRAIRAHARDGTMNRSTYIYREYPKLLTAHDGLVIVQNIAEERAITATASVTSDTPEGARVGVLLTSETQHTSLMLDTGHQDTPIITAENRAERQAGRRERILTLQRERRHRLRRVDYYPSENAAAIIDTMRNHGVGGDASSIINRILSEWSAIPELNTGK
jgi:hypothetical protein